MLTCLLVLLLGVFFLVWRAGGSVAQAPMVCVCYCVLCVFRLSTGSLALVGRCFFFLRSLLFFLFRSDYGRIASTTSIGRTQGTTQCALNGRLWN